MLKIILGFFTLVVLFGCSESPQKVEPPRIRVYTYTNVVEYGKFLNRIEQDAKIITAENDTIAYKKALNDYFVKVETCAQLIKYGSKLDYRPVTFKLINDRGEDVLNLLSKDFQYVYCNNFREDIEKIREKLIL